MEVLRTKHPETHPPSATNLDTYSDLPQELVPVDIIDDTVTEVSGRLYGGAGLGGTDSVSLQHWLLRFGAARRKLLLTVAEFAEWLVNGRPPLSAYLALTSERWIALDKQ